MCVRERRRLKEEISGRRVRVLVEIVKLKKKRGNHKARVLELKNGCAICIS